ncbi:toxin [Patescibacteria group bacterium]|nr:toxin [Patescibacteria group bacterium]MCG2702218.1 toxin [Candidatus Parcubacteria bacterium]MBU4210000.1 toxin [Patescibacteria group bacterium]MBU4264768.1 toxin [Patescibacteria group bacterium]MBU4390106.1 toxin [Patescibacteria group bacterium]
MNLSIEFSEEKNLLLQQTRGVGFDQVINAIKNNKILDNLKHKNKKKYPKQRILIIKIKNYIYAVPYVIDKRKKTIFLKTVYPSRVLTNKYLKRK